MPTACPGVVQYGAFVIWSRGIELRDFFWTIHMTESASSMAALGWSVVMVTVCGSGAFTPARVVLLPLFTSAAPLILLMPPP